VSFVAINLCVASQRVIAKVSIYFVIDSVLKLLDTLVSVHSFIILQRDLKTHAPGQRNQATAARTSIATFTNIPCLDHETKSWKTEKRREREERSKKVGKTQKKRRKEGKRKKLRRKKTKMFVDVWLFVPNSQTWCHYC